MQFVTPKTLSFLRSIKRNNNREWFHARKDQYDKHVRSPMAAIVERLADDFRTIAPDHLAHPRTSLFRPWRDTRFSDNKAPLKTHAGAVFPHRTLGRMNGAALYFEIAPGWVWIGGGAWAPDSTQLYAIREHVAAHYEELHEIVNTAAFRKIGGLKGDRMTRVPRGYPKDHPAAGYLQHRQFIGFREEGPEFALRPDFYKQLVATFTTLAPLCRFFNAPLVERAKRDPARFVMPEELVARDWASLRL